MPHKSVTLEVHILGRCTLLAVVFLCSDHPAAPAALSALSEKTAVESENSYQFLQQFGGSVNSSAGTGDFGVQETEERAAQEASVLTPEDRLLRENIRSVLKLIDGDTVQIDKDIQVRLIGVDDPDFEKEGRSAVFEQMAEKSKNWVRDFIVNPRDALQKYEGLNSKVNFTDSTGTGVVFYYLYFPNAILEDIRRQELKRYEQVAKKSVQGLEETDKDRSDALKASIKAERDKHSAGAAGSLEEPESIDQYVISEAKYYHDDGSLKRSEIFRDGKLIVKRRYDKKGKLLEETFLESSANLPSVEKRPAPDPAKRS